MGVRELKTETEYRELVKSTEPKVGVVADADNKSIIIIDAYAVWCGPCKAIAPDLEKLAVKYGDKAHFVKFDVDNTEEFGDIAQDLKIVAMPTFTFIKDGKVLDKETVKGANRPLLESTIAKLVAS